MPLAPGADPVGYAQGVMARLISWDIARRIAPLKGQLARLDPQREPEVFTDIMAQVMELETYRRELRDMASGEV